ncbi:potassium channel family protein [Aneurinibacillus aneurinilyticus]|jgi:trk system potassium uptake protein TrkA|uniref:TrkA family potassium uptake protein n=2 Tax=Aneurinibacillus aneurinilyticus TaxID=1391 RepID=A0A848D1D6_ANEAE|nr:TrkA family potassium uptake protein [Aneurinibacillus aneurinilyticus]ERI09599.1 putative Ktr system potassium uptake protein A [Aneurinibacillus aneurinilyticus ATCC 12856]MCI1695281.1 TrkA family potassium uptake protein [Aneurinibacillus aneurinilyticus]MED0671094.1 TrkA family potassium uptake protein [Aneurinibacillus aneurinilyticus]MED0706967.1 TrkA family potassium uptake protein [Aneurinibacillus aneurinilyticus]MED0725050.1 TrkA family potassium uptake protein [Aneurinibacillus a
MGSQSYAIIGMGRFGASVAQALYSMGYDVMVMDEDEERIQDHINIATHAVQADSTDEQALREVGIRNFDVVVVAIGADIQASILTTLILKELGVKMIVAKAQNERHGQVLYKVGADRVVFPERDMGLRVAHNLISPNVLDFVELAEEYSIAEVAASEAMDGKSLTELDVRARFGVNVMAIKSGNSFNIAPSATDTIQEGDILVVIGHNDDLKKFEEES